MYRSWKCHWYRRRYVIKLSYQRCPHRSGDTFAIDFRFRASRKRGRSPKAHRSESPTQQRTPPHTRRVTHTATAWPARDRVHTPRRRDGRVRCRLVRRRCRPAHSRQETGPSRSLNVGRGPWIWRGSWIKLESNSKFAAGSLALEPLETRAAPRSDQGFLIRHAPSPTCVTHKKETAVETICTGAPLVRAFLWPSEPPPHVVDGGRTLRLEHRGEALVRAAHHEDALHKVGERRGERRVGGA